jgi:hypothetical protein
MVREKGKLAALSKDLDGRDMSMVRTRIANESTREGMHITWSRLTFYHDQTKASGGPGQRSAATGKYKNKT